jgi:nucleotide-binding universal stress UspA family protein
VGKLFVGLDAFGKNLRSVKSATQTINTFASQAKLQTQALAVLGPQDFSWPTSMSPQWEAFFKATGAEKLNRAAKTLALKTNQPARLILQPEYSKRQSAETLAKTSKEDGAEVLALFTHVTKSAGLLGFGSFAEAVVAKSTTPVLLVNATAKPVKKFKTALFATDFSDEAHQAFQQAVHLAKRMGFNITLFHQLYQASYAMGFAGAAFVPSIPRLELFFEEQVGEAKTKAAAWEKEAARAGVKVRTEIVSSIQDPASEILKWTHGSSRKSADLIIVAPQISGLASIVMGSTSKAVLRKSKKPVLLIHANVINEGKAYAERKIGASHEQRTSLNTIR